MFLSISLRGMMLLDELQVGVEVDVEGRVEVGGGVDAVKRSICPALITRGESELPIFAGVEHSTVRVPVPVLVPVVLVGVEAVGVVVAVALALLLIINSLRFDPTSTTSSPPAQ